MQRNQCTIALSHPNVKKIRELPNEEQDIILMASLIASQLQPNKSPLQINPTLIFLGAITEVKVNNKSKSIFHNFSLIDGMLFTVLKRLEILESFQAFLLSQLGFTNNNLGPFSIRDSGGLTLHLNSPPSISTIIHFNYDKDTNDLLDVINKFKWIKRRIAQNPPTFSEYLILAILELNIPLSAFLFEALDTKDTMEIKNLLYPLFNKVRQNLKLSTGRSNQILKEITNQQTKKEILQEALDLFKDENMTIVEAARRLHIDKDILKALLKEYKEKNGIIINMPNRRYYQKDKILQEAISLRKQGMSTKEAAEQLDVKYSSLQLWIKNYKKENNIITEYNQKDELFATLLAEQEIVVQKAIPLIEQGISLKKITKQLDIKYSTLNRWTNNDKNISQVNPLKEEQMDYPSSEYLKQKAITAITEGDLTLDEAAQEFMMTQEQLKLLIRMHQLHNP